MTNTSVAKFEGRCVAMLADLLHAEGKGPDAAGAASIGSSEAIMLGGLAMKLKWRERRRAKAGDKRELEGMAERPNLVMAANTQVCWHKFCRYFDVEPREVPNDDEHLVLNVEKALEMCDENTIGVCGILGSTYTGEFEDIKALDAGVEALKASKGLTIPIHVDGASGGFVAPFVWPDLEWDFRLKNVVSMNLSGHKFGLVYAGIGWVVWRSWSEVPEPMIFHTNYLGADMKSITMNFSKSASCIVGQYYQFLRLGKEGYGAIMNNLVTIMTFLYDKLEASGHWVMRSKKVGVPLVAFSLKPTTAGEHERLYDEFDVADRMQAYGWVIPAYTMSPNAEHIKLLRAVIREDMSMASAETFVENLAATIDYLDVHFSRAEKAAEASLERKHKREMEAAVMKKWKPHRHTVRKKHVGTC